MEKFKRLKKGKLLNLLFKWKYEIAFTIFYHKKVFQIFYKA